MEKLAKTKVALMLVVFILFGLLPILAAAGQSDAASTADQFDYPCGLLPPDSQTMYNLSAVFGNHAGFIEAKSQPNAPFNYLGIVALGVENTWRAEEARQLVNYYWSQYCERMSAPAWTAGNFGAYGFEYPDGGGAGQQSWSSWRPEMLSTMSVRSLRRGRESPAHRSA